MGRRGEGYKSGRGEWVNIKDTDWYKEMKTNYSPQSNLAFYRKEKKLTQAGLFWEFLSSVGSGLKQPLRNGR